MNLCGSSEKLRYLPRITILHFTQLQKRDSWGGLPDSESSEKWSRYNITCHTKYTTTKISGNIKVEKLNTYSLTTVIASFFSTGRSNPGRLTKRCLETTKGH